jgi:hypothetical protein
MKTTTEILDLMKDCCGMQDISRLMHIGHFLLETTNVTGDVVELGCHEGKLSAVLASLTNKPLWVYDSFQGLPARSTHDITRPDFFPGQLKAERQIIEDRFKAYDLLPPIIVEKWFKDLTPDDLPHRISFALLDGDFHDSIRDSLRAVYKRMTPSGIVAIDDFGWTALPGVKVATDAFMADKPEKIRTLTGQCEQVCHMVYFQKI